MQRLVLGHADWEQRQKRLYNESTARKEAEAAADVPAAHKRPVPYCDVRGPCKNQFAAVRDPKTSATGCEGFENEIPRRGCRVITPAYGDQKLHMLG
jgi:hypothetical protein